MTTNQINQLDKVASTMFINDGTIDPVVTRFNLSDKTAKQLGEMKADFGFNGLGKVVFQRTYSRPKSDGTNEDWKDVVIRVINGVMSIRKDHMLRNSLRWVDSEWQDHAHKMAISMFKMEWLPPGRGLWMMGTDYCYERGGMSLYNCAATTTDDDLVHAAEWTMDSLMNGVGVGFDTTWRGVAMAPDKLDSMPYVVPDTREGWVGSLIALMCSYTNSPLYGSCKYPVFDYSLIRKAGCIIAGFGGTASGFEPLQKLHERVESYFECFCEGVIYTDGKSKPYNHTRLIADIFNSIGACVVAGNVRRSAEIMLGDVTDETFLDLKNCEANPERGEISWMSNNSVTLKANENFKDFHCIPELAKRIRTNGEPGMINLHNIQNFGRTGKPMKDDASLINPCFCGDTLIATADGRGAVSIEELAEEDSDVPVYSIDPLTHEVSIKWGRHPRVTGYNMDLVRVRFSGNNKGEYMDVTPNHKFLLNDGRTVEAKDLKSRDSILNFKKAANGKDDYIVIHSQNHRLTEHRMIKEFLDKDSFNRTYEEGVYNGCCRTHNVVVHHIDDNKHNNHPDNLEITTAGGHNRIHNMEYVGEGNPMYGKTQTAETRALIGQKASERCKDPEYRKRLSDGQTQEHRLASSERMIINKLKWDNERCDRNEKNTDYKTFRSENGASLKVNKVCENEKCAVEFDVDWGSREQGYCSIACANTKREHVESRRAGIRKTWDSRAKETFHAQAMVYKDLEEENDIVMKKQWEEECKVRGITYRFNRDSPNPWIAKGWKEFKIMVEEHNHRVLSVEELPGKHTVYNITVDDNHTLAVVTKISNKGVNLDGVFTINCGEIPLSSKETCNLAEVFPHRCDGAKVFNNSLEYATFFASTVSLHRTHRRETNRIIAMNRRIGVSISGIAQWASMDNHPTWGSMNYTAMTEYLRDGYKIVTRVNKNLAKEAGVPESIRKTTIKPSGSISLLAGATPGGHYPVSRYAIRRVRVGMDSPIVPSLIKARVPYEKDETSDNTWCFEFAIDHGNVRACEDVSPWEQFSVVAMLQRCFVDNSVSNTIYFDPVKDGPDVEKMLAMYIPILKSVSMLPHSGHGYAQAPYEPVDKETYEKLRMAYDDPDFSSSAPSMPSGSKYCSGDTCEL